MKFYSSLLFLFFSLSSFAEKIVVAQENKKFSHDKLVIKQGDTVDFLNSDPFFHNVFSLSDTEMFDLGSYPQGESRTVTFNTPGTVEVECAIHPDMYLEIIVE